MTSSELIEKIEDAIESEVHDFNEKCPTIRWATRYGKLSAAFFTALVAAGLSQDQIQKIVAELKIS